MYKATTSLHSALLFGLIATFMCAPSFAKHDNEYTSQNGHAIVQDVEKARNTQSIDEDQD
ncbi:membrane protein [Vibrio sp. JCM 18904]|nr:membrane protein [Vibrio sp. JCM 18904]